MKPALEQKTTSTTPPKIILFVEKIFFYLKTRSKVYQALLAGAGILVIAGGVFFSLKWYESRQRKVFAASAYQVELPKGINKESLQNLTNEQRAELNNQIVKSLQAKVGQARVSQGISQAVVVILTQNGQPIVPTTGAGGTGGQGPTSAPPTSAPPTGIPPTSPPSSPTPTLTPSPTPKPLIVENVGTIFVTKGTWNGNLGGLTGADSKCQVEAQSAGFSGGWISLLSDSSNYMKNRIPDTIYKNTLGQVIASSKADLFDGSIQNQILFTDGSYAGGLVWTGVDADGKGQVYIGHHNINQDTCGDWTCTLTNAGVPPPYCGSSAGYPFKLDDDWVVAYERGCDNSFKLYCIRTDTGGSGLTPTLTPTSPPSNFVSVPGQNFLVSNIDNGQSNWQAAKSTCAGLNARLPTMAELNILYQQRANFNFKNEAYWSGQESGDEAYYVHFSNGFNNKMDKDFTNVDFRCVKDGVGITPTPTYGPCTDSDNGFNVYVKGTVTQPGHFLSPFVDYCAEVDGVSYDRPYLFEYTCENNYWKMNSYDCPNNSCHNGVCTQSEPTPTPTAKKTPTPTPTPSGPLCTDSDGGRNFNVKGRTVPAPGYSSNEVGVDRCIDSTKLNEYYCHEDGKHLASTEPACPAGCYEGVCLKENECTDSDGGQNFYIKGFVKPKPGYSQDQIGWDNCFTMSGKQMVQEYYCHPEGNLAQTYTECPNGCQDGACKEAPISPTASPQGECTDSDGIDYYARGKVVDKKGKTHEDYCAKDQNASADPDYLAEFSCQKPEADERVVGTAEDTQSSYFTISYDCPAGCQNDVCLPPVTRGSRAGFSVSGEAQDEYKNKYDRDLMADINKIYLTGKEKYGFPQLTKKIDLDVLKVTQIIPSFFNATTNEIVFPQGNLPSEEGLAFLVAASLGKDLTSLPLKKLDQEINKVPVEKIFQDVFEPLSKKEAPVPTEKPINPPTGGPTQKPVSGCAGGWEEYSSQKHGFKFKIPPGWTLEPAIKKPETDSFTEIEIMSTTHPEARVDPAQRISSFFIVASKKDPKTDEEYGYKSRFEDYTGNQIKSQIEFKGIQTEKIVDETPMVGEHRFELYYFKYGDFYYLLNLGIYTADLKEKNEKILNCFLEHFELLGQPASTETKSPSGLIPCSDDLLSTSEQLKERQENWWEKPDPCDSQPEHKICGYIKSIYDNNMVQISSSDYRNPYCYCSSFEKNGRQGLRGTEMFALGYKEGVCVK